MLIKEQNNSSQNSLLIGSFGVLFGSKLSFHFLTLMFMFVSIFKIIDFLINN